MASLLHTYSRAANLLHSNFIVPVVRRDMKSAFGSRRKPRKIEVDEDDETPQQQTNIQFSETPSITGHKAFKKSSLRQSMTFENEHSDNNESGDSGLSQTGASKPSVSRSDSSRRKKKSVKSRLSFGPGEIVSGDAAEELEDEESFTPKKSILGRRTVQNNAIRKSFPAYQIPTRAGEDDDERPIYSRDYLLELKSSTPSTPKDLGGLSVTVDDDDGLNESELEGAMVVEMENFDAPAAIPTEAEIREKKDRRARLAKEQDFISLDSPGDDRRSLFILPRKKKAESRLVREDEDLGEGFDEFVDDGRISLGKRQEREARRKQRKQMAEMIHAAEGSSSDDSNDSERERQAAYEVAQTRAGMDGLSKPHAAATHQAPPKITPIPNLSECLQRLQMTLAGMKQELTQRNQRMEELQVEKTGIILREQEVQRLLKEAGDRYTSMNADVGFPAIDPATLSTRQNGFAPPMVANRGLESFGNTPVGRSEIEDIG